MQVEQKLIRDFYEDIHLNTFRATEVYVREVSVCYSPTLRHQNEQQHLRLKCRGTGRDINPVPQFF